MKKKLSIEKVETPPVWYGQGRHRKYPELIEAIDALEMEQTVAVKCLDYHTIIGSRQTMWCPIAGNAITISRRTKDYDVKTMHADGLIYIKKIEKQIKERRNRNYGRKRDS